MTDAPGQIDIAPSVTLPAAALRFRYARSSGPGGQNVNKLNTKATLTIALDDLAAVLPAPVMTRLTRACARYIAGDRFIITCQENRTQIANKNACLDRLRQLIVRAQVRPRKRKPTRPTRSSVENRLESKRRNAAVKKQRRKPTSESD